MKWFSVTISSFKSFWWILEVSKSKMAAQLPELLVLPKEMARNRLAWFKYRTFYYLYGGYSFHNGLFITFTVAKVFISEVFFG